MSEVHEPSNDSVLQEAQKIIYGDREQTYGRPDLNLNRIAALWETYLHEKYLGNIAVITAEDVCWMMTLMKCARQMNAPKRDNLVDACGYISLIERMENARRSGS